MLGPRQRDLDGGRAIAAPPRPRPPDPGPQRRSANAIAFARYSDATFGWGVRDPGHGLVFAKADRTQDAAAAAALGGSGKYGPLLLIESADTLPPQLEAYLLDIQPGYRFDPVRGVYNHAWILGDESAISLRRAGPHRRARARSCACATKASDGHWIPFGA